LAAIKPGAARRVAALTARLPRFLQLNMVMIVSIAARIESRPWLRVETRQIGPRVAAYAQEHQRGRFT
jgi:hypothetical protein